MDHHHSLRARDFGRDVRVECSFLRYEPSESWIHLTCMDIHAD